MLTQQMLTSKIKMEPLSVWVVLLQAVHRSSPGDISSDTDPINISHTIRFYISRLKVAFRNPWTRVLDWTSVGFYPISSHLRLASFSTEVLGQSTFARNVMI